MLVVFKIKCDEVGLELKEAIKKLYQWQHGQRDENDFDIQLFTSFQKASIVDFEKLASVYPVHAKAYTLWHESADTKALFASFGIKK